MDEFDQVVLVGQDLIEELDKHQKKNLELFETIKNNFNEIIRIRKQQMEEIKSDIQALLNEQEELEKPGQTPEIGETAKQEKQLQQEYSVVKQSQEELSAQCKVIEAEREQLKEDMDKLVEEKARLENETTILLPMKREELMLYSRISNIRWDFEGSNDEVKGYISNRSEVTPFCFDKRKCSQFFITNSLWDSMKED